MAEVLEASHTHVICATLEDVLAAVGATIEDILSIPVMTRDRLNAEILTDQLRDAGVAIDRNISLNISRTGSLIHLKDATATYGTMVVMLSREDGGGHVACINRGIPGTLAATAPGRRIREFIDVPLLSQSDETIESVEDGILTRIRLTPRRGRIVG